MLRTVLGWQVVVLPASPHSTEARPIAYISVRFIGFVASPS